MVDHPPQPANDDNTKAHRLRRLIQKPAVAGPLVLVLLVFLLLACVLWIPQRLYPPLTDNDLKDVRIRQTRLMRPKSQRLMRPKSESSRMPG